MNRNKPEQPSFYLSRVAQPERREQPRIFPVTLADLSSLGRRDVLRLGGSVSAATALAGLWRQAAVAAGSVIAAHRGPVASLTIVERDSLLVSSSPDDYLKIWKLPDGVAENVTDLKAGAPVVASPDEKRLAYPDQIGHLWICSLPDLKTLGFLSAPGARSVASFAASPDWSSFAIGNGPDIEMLRILERPLGLDFAPVRTLDTGFGPAVFLTAVGSTLVAGAKAGTISAWDFSAGSLLGRFETGAPILAMLPLPRLNAVATGHGDGKILISRLPSGTQILRLRATSAVHALTTGPREETLITGGEDGSISVWTLPAGDRANGTSLTFGGTQSRRPVARPASKLTALTVSAAARVLVAGNTLGQAVLLDWPSLELRSYLFDPAANDPEVKGVMYQVLEPATGRVITFTLPCGSPIPPGATCLCNCVPGNPGSRAPLPVSIPTTKKPERITQPCPAPIPPGYECTCNCVPGR